MSDNLDLGRVSASQNQKEVTINNALERLDAALSDSVTYLITSTNARILTNAEIQRFHFWIIDEDGVDPATAAIMLTLPAIERGLFVVINATAFVVTVEITSQAETSPTVDAATATLLSSDGVNVRVAGGAGGASIFTDLTDTPAAINAHKMLVGNAAGTALQEKDISYDVGSNFAGVPIASEVIMRYLAPRPFRLPAGLTNSQGRAGVAATAQTDFDIQRNGSSVGTMSFAIAAQVPTFTMATLTDFAISDRLEIVGPATPDSTLADIAVTLAGTRRPAT